MNILLVKQANDLIIKQPHPMMVQGIISHNEQSKVHPEAKITC